jgi:hypothetical protein
MKNFQRRLAPRREEARRRPEEATGPSSRGDVARVLLLEEEAERAA